MAGTNSPTSLLSGYRVLDLTSSMGAFCAKLLRDLGMDVIKVEPCEGDATRCEAPFAKGHADREGSLRFAYLNAGKRSITLNIATENGRKLLLDLVARSDIVVEDFTPGYLSTRNLGYEVLLERQNKLMSATPWAACSISAAIHKWPRAIRPRRSRIITLAYLLRMV